MITVESVFAEANSCSSHPLDPIALEGVETLIGLGGCECFPTSTEYERCESYCSTQSFAVGLLKDGKFVRVEESSDTSGHGCQCSGSASVHDTWEELLINLTQGQRELVVSNLGPDGFAVWVGSIRKAAGLDQ